jgi:hypothetical protein
MRGRDHECNVRRDVFATAGCEVERVVCDHERDPRTRRLCQCLPCVVRPILLACHGSAAGAAGAIGSPLLPSCACHATLCHSFLPVKRDSSPLDQTAPEQIQARLPKKARGSPPHVSLVGTAFISSVAVSHRTNSFLSPNSLIARRQSFCSLGRILHLFPTAIDRHTGTAHTLADKLHWP